MRDRQTQTECVWEREGESVSEHEYICMRTHAHMSHGMWKLVDSFVSQFYLYLCSQDWTQISGLHSKDLNHWAVLLAQLQLVLYLSPWRHTSFFWAFSWERIVGILKAASLVSVDIAKQLVTPRAPTSGRSDQQSFLLVLLLHQHCGMWGAVHF